MQPQLGLDRVTPLICTGHQPPSAPGRMRCWPHQLRSEAAHFLGLANELLLQVFHLPAQSQGHGEPCSSTLGPPPGLSPGPKAQPSLCSSLRPHLGRQVRDTWPGPDSLQHPLPPQDPANLGSQKSLQGRCSRGDHCATPGPQQGQLTRNLSGVTLRMPVLHEPLPRPLPTFTFVNFISFFLKRAPKLYKLQAL